jgi:hypothetical protein
VEDGKPFFRYTFFDIADVTIPGSDKLPSGKVTVSTRFQPDGTRAGSSNQDETPQTLKIWMAGYGLHQPSPQFLAAVLLQNKYVAPNTVLDR